MHVSGAVLTTARNKTENGIVHREVARSRPPLTCQPRPQARNRESLSCRKAASMLRSSGAWSQGQLAFGAQGGRPRPHFAVRAVGLVQSHRNGLQLALTTDTEEAMDASEPWLRPAHGAYFLTVRSQITWVIASAQSA
eukprot:362018-Chlamydomonas_euryale.AAC.9